MIQILDQLTTMCYTTRSIDIETKIQHADDIITACVHVPADSIWFDGHFPEMAILPGIAQLAIVVRLLDEALGKKVQVRGVSRVRFKQAIMPSESIEVQIRPKENDALSYGFRLLKGQELVCSGFITVAAEP